MQCRKISAYTRLSRVKKQMLAFGVFSRLKANTSLLLLEQRNGRRSFKKLQVTRQFTFEKAWRRSTEKAATLASNPLTSSLWKIKASHRWWDGEGGIYWRVQTSCLGDFLKCEIMAAVEDNQSSGNVASHGPEDVAGKPPNLTFEGHRLLPVFLQQVASAGVEKVQFNWPANYLLGGTCDMTGLNIYQLWLHLQS